MRETGLRKETTDDIAIPGRIPGHNDVDIAGRWGGGGRAVKALEGRRRRMDGHHGGMGICGDGGCIHSGGLRQQ
jgi:hypothetical protein